MTMRCRAALLVLALLLTPLASVVCELKCASPAESQPATGHAACHDADSGRAYFLQAHVHHCVIQHADAVTIGIETGAALSARKPLATHAVSSIEGRMSPIECASAPPGTRSVTGAVCSSSPPLRI